MRDRRIAVLMTCHNRRVKTIACLNTLFNQELDEKCQLFVYLVDDGCTDGTGKAVRAQFSDVKILQGDGSLYWCGGMRVAWVEAMKNDYDYYLWLNDDTILFPNAINILFKTAQHKIKDNSGVGIFVGSIWDKKRECHSYGGHVQIRKKNPFDLRRVIPADVPLPCDTFNGNCVLIASQAAISLGNLSSEFTHGIADTDYGLRARKAGIPCWVAPGYLGICSINYESNDWANPELPMAKRWKLLHSPKGIPPREWIILTKRHAGYRWPIFVVKLYLRCLFPKVWNRLHDWK
jgi:GT2 family glycosyltransferase